MGNRKSWFLVAGFTIVVMLGVLLFEATNCTSVQAAEVKTIKIGGLFGLTGFLFRV